MLSREGSHVEDLGQGLGPVRLGGKPPGARAGAPPRRVATEGSEAEGEAQGPSRVRAASELKVGGVVAGDGRSIQPGVVPLSARGPWPALGTGTTVRLHPGGA